MYNRYIPQDDGTYHKNRIQDPEQSQKKASQPTPQTTFPQPPAEPCIPPPQTPPICRQDIHATNFLKQLIPKNLDTADLLIILLLLLMAGGPSDDQNFALLTLALYLFL